MEPIEYEVIHYPKSRLATVDVGRFGHDTHYMFGLLALFRALLVTRHAWMDSFTRSAYLMYAIHYVYVTWVQYLLLGVTAHAAVKFAITCVTVVGASWLTAWLLLKIPRLKAVM